jgi:hypothetical protein
MASGLSSLLLVAPVVATAGCRGAHTLLLALRFIRRVPPAGGEAPLVTSWATRGVSVVQTERDRDEIDAGKL